MVASHDRDAREPDMAVDLPSTWRHSLQDDLAADYFADLLDFVAAERRMHAVFPPSEDVFAAFRLTPLDVVRVVILGQDPYHDHGQAHGLCFSVRPGVKPPPSLMNIFKELQADVGCDLPNHGCLESWARQGIMLINAVLTVRAHQAHSHRNRGWERFTDAVIRAINARGHGVVFVLWGKPAQKKRSLIDVGRHRIIEAPHPSPLSARRGFFGSRPFSKINQLLVDRGEPPIDWCLDHQLAPFVPHRPPEVKRGNEKG